MGKALFVQAEPETKLPDLDFVSGNCGEMSFQPVKERLIAFVSAHIRILQQGRLVLKNFSDML